MAERWRDGPEFLREKEGANHTGTYALPPSFLTNYYYSLRIPLGKKNWLGSVGGLAYV